MSGRHARCFEAPLPPWVKEKVKRPKNEYREPPDKEDADKMKIGVYKAEAKTRIKAGKHDQAIEMYTKALEVNPKDSACLTARAASKFEAGDYEGALEDAQAARDIDRRNAKALLMMAESLYHQSEFEQALVCYHRAKRLKTTAPEVDRGIFKCEEAINNAIGEKAGVKLELIGDLSYFDELQQNERSGVQLIVRMTSARHRARQRKEAQESPRRSKPSDGSKNQRQFDAGYSAKSLKQLLGELYDDHVYLMQLLGEQENTIESVDTEEKVDDAEWRKRMRDKRDAQRDDGKDDDYWYLYEQGGAMNKHGPKQKRRNKTKKFAKGVQSICEDELGYLDERCEFWAQQGGVKAEERQQEASERRAAGSKVALILRSLENIEADQSDGEYMESLRKGHKTLRVLEKVSEQEQPRQPELLATLYSLIGNAYYEMELFPKAMTYYQKDLDLCTKKELEEGKSRAQDNLGRTHAKRGNYSKAIKIFEERMSSIQGPLESTWLYHELGRCYLESKKYSNAVSCAEKAVTAAADTDDNSWKLNANVLLAQAQVEMENQQEALEAFEHALKVAKADGDKPAIDAIEKAMVDVKKKIKDEVKEEEGAGDAAGGDGDGAGDGGGDDTQGAAAEENKEGDGSPSAEQQEQQSQAQTEEDKDERTKDKESEQQTTSAETAPSGADTGQETVEQQKQQEEPGQQQDQQQQQQQQPEGHQEGQQEGQQEGTGQQNIEQQQEEQKTEG